MPNDRSRNIVHVRTNLEPEDGWSSLLLNEVEVSDELYQDVQNKKIRTGEEFWRRYLSE
jgi:hypothetical protein